MKRIRLMLSIFVVVLISSCVSTPKSERPAPKSVVKAVKNTKTVAILGYNSSTGFDDRALNNLDTGLFDISLDVDLSLGNGVKFPITKESVNTSDQDFYTMLKELNSELVSKKNITSSVAYKKIKGDPNMDLNNVVAADGYTLTYRFNNWMDSQESIPLNGQIVNTYKATLKEIGADLGVIVVHKPYIRFRQYGLIPGKLFYGKKDFFTVSVKTLYHIVRPALGNQVLYTKEIIVDADKMFYTKGYKKADRKKDEKGFMEEVPGLINKSDSQFVKWFNNPV